MADLFGYDFDEARKAKEESLPKNLTAGEYKMMITQVELGNHPFGGQFTALGPNEVPTADFEIRVSCVLTEAANGFKEGWKHTLFFSTMRMDKDNPGKLSRKAIIDRADLADLSMVCCGGKAKSEQELVNKQFYIVLKETVGKDGKSYLNIDKISSAPSTSAAPAAATAQASNTDKPGWANNTESSASGANWL